MRLRAGMVAGSEIVVGTQLVMALIESGQPPSPPQQTQIDAALDAAHTALQNAQPRVP